MIKGRGKNLCIGIILCGYYGYGKLESLPWYSPLLDHDIQKTLEIINPPVKKLLSLGEGPGTQAIALAKMGYSVTATDISEAAIEKARKRHFLINHRNVL